MPGITSLAETRAAHCLIYNPWGDTVVRTLEQPLNIFATRWFERFARKQQISAPDLCEAVMRAESGLIDADLGSGLIKQRIARPGKGRSGGYRTVIAYRMADRAVFLFGFAKSARDNISDDDLADLKATAGLFLGLSDEALMLAVNEEKLMEIQVR